MPAGTYLHLAGELEERFQCAPGPGGWRYTSRRDDGVRADLVVDARWRQIRVELVTPGWWLRGGVTGPELAWVRAAGETGTEHAEPAAGFVSESPGFLVAIAHSLALDEGAHTDVRLVQVTGTSLAVLTTMWRWRRAGSSTYETETAPLPVQEYEVTDLATGEAGTVHMAGDVVLAGPGIELADLETPPNFLG